MLRGLLQMIFCESFDKWNCASRVDSGREEINYPFIIGKSMVLDMAAPRACLLAGVRLFGKRWWKNWQRKFVCRIWSAHDQSGRDDEMNVELLDNMRRGGVPGYKSIALPCALWRSGPVIGAFKAIYGASFGIFVCEFIRFQWRVLWPSFYGLCLFMKWAQFLLQIDVIE